MRHSFQTYMFHMHYACQACRFGIASFWIASQCSSEHAYDETPSLNSVKILAA
jgi:hypothetical protein